MKILDLFCGAGGAAMGIHRALPDAEIIGVDIKPQPHYPFAFIQADALHIPLDLRRFDFAWASPTCQAYSKMTKMVRLRGEEFWNRKTIPAVREMLLSAGIPYVIENVPDAKEHLRATIMLCGSMFNLGVWRHRLFESNLLLMQPAHSVMEHDRIAAEGRYCCVVGMGGNWYKRHGSRKTTDWKREMGIDWMSRYELTQAVPPAYAEYIMRFLFGKA